MLLCGKGPAALLQVYLLFTSCQSNVLLVRKDLQHWWARL